MKKALISINADLGSSIALRYVTDISDRFQMTLYDVHVVEPKQAGAEPGSGWVQKTWENALVENGKEEIRQFLSMENIRLPLLKNPKILVGDRTEKLLSELQEGQYDLFLEGVPPTSNPMDFSSLLNSRLYRSMPCSVLVVKNLVRFDKVAFLVSEDLDPERFASCFFNIFKGNGFGLDLIRVTLDKSGEPVVEEHDTTDSCLKALNQALSQNGMEPKMLKTIKGSPVNVADLFREYGLVVSSLVHSMRRKNPVVELLGRIASPILICWH